MPIAQAAFSIDDGEWRAMDGGDCGLFRATTPGPDRLFRLSVCVTDQNLQQDIDTIEAPRSPTFNRRPTGSDAGRGGAWPERHLLGTKLGPNKNGRKW